jgi:phospholipid transport system substrate-binding protein
MLSRAIATMLAVILSSATYTSAGTSPRGELEEFFRRALAIQREATSARQARDEVRGLAWALFDGRTAAQRALGNVWNQRTPAERDEFAQTFRDLLQRAYVDVVQARLPRDPPPTVRVLSEAFVGPRAAIVRTKVRTRDGGDVQLDYRMSRPDKAWLIRDVAIDGVDLVENYRVQFARVLRQSSYGELLARLRTVAGAPVVASTATPPRSSDILAALTQVRRGDSPSQTP